MAESILFVLIVGIILITIIAFLGWHTWFDPRLVILVLFVLLIPGLYGAFTTGPFVPSSRKRHRTMIRLAKLSKKDIVYDLGSGGGGIVFEASKHAKKATGIEISIPLILYCRLKAFVTRSGARFKMGSLWQQDYSDATVIFAYLMPHSMKKIHKEIWPTLKPGTRVISNAFRMHDLKPIAEAEGVHVYEV